MPELKEVFNAFVSKTLNMDEDGVASLFNEDGSALKDEALQQLLEKDASRIAGIKPDTKKFFDDGYKKAQSETLSNFEKMVSEKYGIKSEKKGIELIDDLVGQFKDQTGTDEEKVKKSKYFLDFMEAANREKEELKTNLTTEFENFKKQVERDKHFSEVSNQALVIFENLKPILPEDAEKANNLKKVFINELTGFSYEVREGSIVILDKDGNDATDSHGHRIKFDSLVKSTAEKYFDFYKSDDKASAVNKQNNSKSPVYKINSEADYIRLRAEAKTPEEKSAVLDAYNLAIQERRI